MQLTLLLENNKGENMQSTGGIMIVGSLKIEIDFGIIYGVKVTAQNKRQFIIVINIQSKYLERFLEMLSTSH